MLQKILPRLASLSLLWVLLAIFSAPARAGDLAYRLIGGGLQMSLSTSGYQFEIDDGTVEVPLKTKAQRAAKFQGASLVASVVLANRGNVPAPFVFADAAAAERKFRFKVFQEDGTQVWESEADAAGESQAVEASLVKRSPWRRTVQVPLNLDGTWLASGRYTLEASVDAEGGPGATAVFEVVNLREGSIPPAENTGILGKVLMSSDKEPASNAEEMPPAKDLPVRAFVMVREIIPPNVKLNRAPYTWSGSTDSEGNFRAPTTAGRFRVTARPDYRPTPALANASAAIVASTTVEVEVSLGQFAEVELKLGSGPVILNQAKVHSVEEVHVEYLPTLATPGMLRITASGTVSSGGWSNARLIQRPRAVSAIPSGTMMPVLPVNVLEFDLVATPPTGAATTVMSPISASTQIPVPAEVREIRVYSRTNSQSVLLP